MIIHQTLLNMFPLDSFDPATVAPFTANEFIQRILVPEVALRLIMEDRGLKGLMGAETALQVLRDSTAYGVVMFPEDSGEGARRNDHKLDAGVGDRIVMERARKRRKEIEIEEGGNLEEVEMEAFLWESETERGGREGTRRQRSRIVGGGSGSNGAESSRGSELDDDRALVRPSRKSRRKARSTVDEIIYVDSMSDGHQTESSAKTDGALVRSRPRRNTKAVNYTDTSSDDDGKGVARRRQWSISKHRSRTPSRTPSKQGTSMPSRSPSVSEWPEAQPRSRSRSKEQIKLQIQPFPMSDVDMDICSTDEDTAKRKKRAGGGKSHAGSPRKSSNKRSLESKHQGEDKVVDLDVNTPIPKRHGVKHDADPTPRPVRKTELGTVRPQESILERARARQQKSGGPARYAFVACCTSGN